MRSKEEALANPMAGDRWRDEYDEEYTVRWVLDGKIGDQCTDGINNPSEVLENPLNLWRLYMNNAKYLGGTNE